MRGSSSNNRRKGTKGAPSADLLVCFPTRAHLSLMPKPICSPARSSENSKRLNEIKKITSARIGGQASPLLWAKSKASHEVVSEPTSPKVTCAGQIKVRPKQASTCKNWQSVMEEIEKLHNRKKQKKKGGNWMEAIGLKKDVMQFLTCLRNIKFEFRCFGSFPTATDHETSSDEEDDDGEEERGLEDEEENEETSRTVFSKWFMVLQDQNQNVGISNTGKDNDDNSEQEHAPCAPPPNALLLMRCRSAPPKSWLEERQQNDEDDEDDEYEEKNEKSTTEEIENIENESEKENLVVMRYGSDFCKFSADIAKETWVVGGVRDSLARSRSWKR